MSPDGKVMTDLASISRLNWRAFPLPSKSVYFDVSSRVMNGLSLTSKRRNHLVCVLPSKPGSSSRNGYPCSGRNASPFCPYTSSASFSIFSRGMLRVITAASAPSASTQEELSLRPTSRAIVANCTPVHSDVLSKPCVPCTCLQGRFVPLSQSVARTFNEMLAGDRWEAFYVGHRK